MLHRQPRPDQIDSENLLPVRHLLLEQRGEPARNAGIGEEDVEAAMFSASELDKPAHVLVPPRIGGDHPFGRGDIGGDHDRPLLAKPRRGRPADPRRGAGDDRDLVLESHSLFSVIPAKAGIQLPSLPGLRKRSWIPAFAGMTWRGVTVPLPPY